MDRELKEHAMIERVEMIARLTVEGTCQERDREIALNLIAEIARDNLMKKKNFSVVFSPSPVHRELKKDGDMRVNIMLDKDQKIEEHVIAAFKAELTRRVKSLFPSTHISFMKGSMNGVELTGFDKESDRKALDNLIQQVLENYNLP
ncbi:DinI-like family protein [Kosakonia cowanii]|uniref:DinI-like family protein n=1 Tax=Kosakonia cowanii TaxID=208223 RepID=UPI001E4164A0|nr:DinI-like family protein [Kosakonia cowanii]UGS46673.1 DinI-like family protein [Kosakonia cowanii]